MDIRHEILEKHFAAAALEELADKYSRQGFEIEREVAFGDERADLVARKGDQVLVFEVKAGEWTPEKREATRKLRDRAVREDGARFILVLAPQAREKTLELEGLGDILLDVVESQGASALAELASHARVGGVSNIDLTSMTVGPEGIDVVGTASVDIEIQYGSGSDLGSDLGFAANLSAPLEFHLLLNQDRALEKVVDFHLDLSELEE